MTILATDGNKVLFQKTSVHPWNSFGAQKGQISIPDTPFFIFFFRYIRTTDLAQKIVAMVNSQTKTPLMPMYLLEQTVKEKIEAVARTCYGADGVVFEPKARQALTTTKHCCTPPGSLHHIEWHRTLHCSMDLANSTRQTWICPCQQATCNDQNVRQA